MSLASRFADQVIARHGSDPWVVADALNIGVFRDRLSGPCREVYFSLEGGKSGIIVAVDADRQETRELLAHGIAHHLLHCGNRLQAGGRKAIWSGRHEREADDFAAYLLIPESRLIHPLTELDAPPLAELAWELGVSQDLARRRSWLLLRDLEVFV